MHYASKFCHAPKFNCFVSSVYGSKALKKLKVLEEEAEEEEEWANLSEDQRKEKETELKDAIDNASQSNQMAARSVQMVVLVTETTSK